MRMAIVFALTSGVLVAQSDTEKRLKAASVSFEEVMKISDQAIPQDLFNKAHCVVIIPGMKKGAFIFGAQYGRGFLSCRKPGGVGWTGTGAVRTEGGSFGLQIGGAETDVFMLVMNESGKGKLLSSKFTIGAEASAAAGPVGRETRAQTDAQMRAEILTWSRARGAFAGVSLQGASLREDADVNKTLYGKPVTNKEIAFGKIDPPDAAKELLALFNTFSPKEVTK